MTLAARRETHVALSGVSIGRPLARLRRGFRTGVVSHVFDRAIGLRFGELVIWLVSPDLGNGPLNVVVQPPAGLSGPDFSKWPEIQPGDSAVLNWDDLWMSDRLVIRTGSAHVWEPRPAISPSPSSWALLGQALHAIQRVLLEEQPEQGLAPLAVEWEPAGTAVHIDATRHVPDLQRHLLLRVRRGVDLLREGVRTRSAEVARRGAQQIGGLGTGLTPSGDDFLAGFLLTWTVFAERSSWLVKAILEGSSGRTGPESVAWLRCAARGEASEALKDLFEAIALPHGDPGEARLTSLIRRVLDQGATSGGDLLLGVLFGGKCLVDLAPGETQ